MQAPAGSRPFQAANLRTYVVVKFLLKLAEIGSVSWGRSQFGNDDDSLESEALTAIILGKPKAQRFVLHAADGELAAGQG